MTSVNMGKSQRFRQIKNVINNTRYLVIKNNNTYDPSKIRFGKNVMDRLIFDF